jgi:hypothetical protein
MRYLWLLVSLQQQLLLLFLCSSAVVVVTSFSSPYPTTTSSLAGRRVVDLDENAPRDVYTMESWCVNCGVQKADGFQLVSSNNNYQQQQEDGGGGVDFYAMTQQPLPAGSPVLFVPNEMIFSSSKAAQEFGGALLGPAENQLTQANLGYNIPLFRVFCNVLAEYEKGEESPWFPWLNSLPRRYNNGASMTFGEDTTRCGIHSSQF